MRSGALTEYHYVIATQEMSCYWLWRKLMKPTPEDTRSAMGEADKLNLSESQYWPWIAGRLGVKPSDVTECVASTNPYFWYEGYDNEDSAGNS